MIVHPIAILVTIVAVIANYRYRSRRKLLLVAGGIYALAIITTATYFVPALMEFAHAQGSSVRAAEWYQRGQTWQYLSWLRGCFMLAGFVSLLIALTKADTELASSRNIRARHTEGVV
jgi:hypothetical protein